jgi:hypothetical protein
MQKKLLKHSILPYFGYFLSDFLLLFFTVFFVAIFLIILPNKASDERVGGPLFFGRKGVS